MTKTLNCILDFFYFENTAISAYNNRLIFDVPETQFYTIIELLEKQQCLEAVGIRHPEPGYNLYRITASGKKIKESGGFKIIADGTKG